MTQAILDKKIARLEGQLKNAKATKSREVSKILSLILLLFVFLGTEKIVQAEETQYEKLSKQYLEALELFRDENSFEVIQDGFKQVQFIAEQGHPMAQFWLGQCYNNGWGTVKDPVQSFKWHNKAAEQGDLKGLYWAGLQYLSGDGVIRDRLKGCQYLRTAAEVDAPDGEGINSIKLQAITAYNEYCH